MITSFFLSGLASPVHLAGPHFLPPAKSLTTGKMNAGASTPTARPLGASCSPAAPTGSVLSAVAAWPGARDGAPGAAEGAWAAGLAGSLAAAVAQARSSGARARERVVSKEGLRNIGDDLMWGA